MSLYFMTLTFEIEAKNEQDAEYVAQCLADEAIYEPSVKDIKISRVSP